MGLYGDKVCLKCNKVFEPKKPYYKLCDPCNQIERWKNIDIEIVEWGRLFDFSCAYCGGYVEHYDHVVPQLNGFGWAYSTKWNEEHFRRLVPSCAWCNQSKGPRDLREWYKSKPFYNEARLAIIENWIR